MTKLILKKNLDVMATITVQTVSILILFKQLEQIGTQDEGIATKQESISSEMQNYFGIRLIRLNEKI